MHTADIHTLKYPSTQLLTHTTQIRRRKSEQVTDFKYLGYRVSEYKSDLEDKLQALRQNKRSYTETFWKTNVQRNKVKNSQHYG